MKIYRLSWVLAVALLGACGGSEPTVAPATDTVAGAIQMSGRSSGISVGGEAIPAVLLDTFAARRGYDLKDPDQLRMAQEQLVTLVALAQHALQTGARESAELELNRLDLLSGYAIATGLSALPELDDATLRQRYDEQLARIGNLEYRVRHVLFRNGALAQDALQLLQAGQSFESMMASYQNNPAVPEARELPWIHLGRIPPQDEALASAIRDTPVGTASQQLVITPSGWHLIEVLETRAFTPPEFDALKDGIRQTEERSRRENLVKQIRADAQVQGFKP